MRVVGQWRKLQQTGSVAGYADYVFRLKALCDMGEAAEFKLAFFGLQPELQAEVRKYLRQNRLRQLELEKLFAVAQDAEVGISGRFRRRGHVGQDGSAFGKPGAKKEGSASANTVMLDVGNGDASRKGGRSTEKRVDGAGGGHTGSKCSTTSSWGSGGTRRTDRSKNDSWQSKNDSWGWGRSRDNASTGNGNGRRYASEGGGGSLCFICDKVGHGWVNCPQKRSGRGCFRCGSESHQFSKCPQRKDNNTSSGWDSSGSQDDDDLLACSISMVET